MTDPALTYTSYLALDEVLSAQRPRSDEHDELLFIVIHQVYELWFKQILHELGHAQAQLEGGATAGSLHTLRRILTILKLLVAQIDVLETMTPRQFTGFRHRLDASSGFQSRQFRELEAVLGRRDPAVLGAAADQAPARRRLEDAMARRSLHDSFFHYLAAHGYPVPADALERDASAPVSRQPQVDDVLLAVYADDAGPAQVAERLVDLDEGLQEWRYRHVKMLECTIGDKTGTGGSSGAGYLRSTLFTPLFPDLWAIRSRLDRRATRPRSRSRQRVAGSLPAVTATAPTPRRYVVRTFGCQMNEHDSERIAGLLQADGLVAATDAADADVVVLNTCCIRENADNKLYGNLGHLKTWKAQRDGRQIIVSGCLAQKDRDIVRQRAAHVDVVLGTHNVHRAAELIEVARTTGPVTEIFDAAVVDDYAMFPSALPAVRDTSYNAWVTIQIGCDNHCAFCIVPAVRGVEMSRPFEHIVTEIEQLAADGVTEVTLLGQNVNSYGRDLQVAARRDGDATAKLRPLFANLLRAAGAVTGIRRVRFTSPHPKDMRPETFAAMAGTPAVCPHLHYPLQSGSDRVLALMHRGYTAHRYLDRLADARRTVPDLAVSTDIIVGFPGETEDDFEQTLEVAAAARFDDAFTFIFSPRPGTEASAMTDRFVDPVAAGARFERLRVVVERSALAGNQARVGGVEEVLVSGPSKKDPAVVSARTAQHRLVHFTPPRSLRAGTYAAVEITGAAPHHLTGRFVELVAEPAHRTRIPVAAH